MTDLQGPGSRGVLPIDLAAHSVLVPARHGWMLSNRNDKYIGNSLITYGEFSEFEAVFLRQLLGGSGTMVEVGANIGAHTIPLAKLLASRGRELVAFEPQPVIFQTLCANLALNGITNVRAWPFACGAAAGTLHFRAPDYHAEGNFGGVEFQADATATGSAVPCVRLDDTLGDAVISVMKIDVEGFERRVLQGAEQILRRSRPTLYVENDRRNESAALIDYLWSLDYRLWWHLPLLFNADNYFGNPENIYGNIGSINMLGLPRESTTPVSGLVEVTDARDWPL